MLNNTKPVQHAGSTSSKPNRERTHGNVIECNGTHAIIAAQIERDNSTKENIWAVGQLITIQELENRIVGQSFKVETVEEIWADTDANLVHIHIELVGEIKVSEEGEPIFTSGITNYPRMGAAAHRIRAEDLSVIYANNSPSAIKVGHLTQEATIPAKVNLDKLLSRHFCVVGSTGVGKSTSVSLILRKIIEQRTDIRVIILDPHNEFTAAFADQSIVKDASNLQLPFWMFRFAEFTEVIFRGQKGFDEEAEILRDIVAAAKERFAAGEEEAKTGIRRKSATQGFTADSPVPYRLADIFKLIDERLGLLDGKHEKPILKSLHSRLTTISRDPRFEFMFGQHGSGDRFKSIAADLFRVPQYGKPICVVDMSDLPSEVVSSVVSVLCRMAFDLAVASSGAIQTLVVCEEAHRYIPADKDAGFWPTRQAIARIAKEGRKYGVYLGIVSQRPSELDPTILSQCNTVFAMRLANQADQRIIGGALSNGAQSTIDFLSSIANRECIAFGEALYTPMRLMFETIPKELLPGSTIYEMQESVRKGAEIDLNGVIQRLRGNIPDDESDVEFIGNANTHAGVPQRESIPKPAETPAGLRDPFAFGNKDLRKSQEPVNGKVSTMQAGSQPEPAVVAPRVESASSLIAGFRSRS